MSRAILRIFAKVIDDIDAIVRNPQEVHNFLRHGWTLVDDLIQIRMPLFCLAEP